MAVNCPSSSSKGFTLMELIVAVSISLVLFGVTLVAYLNFNRNRILTEATSEIKTQLRFIRSKAVLGEKPSGCTRLLFYQAKIDSAQKLSWSAFCDPEGERPAGEYSVADVSLSVDSHWPIEFQALSGTVNDQATLTINYGSGSDSLTIQVSGTID